jgi:hypothetical protein
LLEEIPQYAAPGKRILQMEFVDLAHERQHRVGNGHGW